MVLVSKVEEYQSTQPTKHHKEMQLNLSTTSRSISQARNQLKNAYYQKNSYRQFEHYNMQIQSKLPTVGTTIFTTMSKMAVDYNAINLGQGFPDFNADEKLLNLVSQAMLDGHNQYPLMTGINELRDVISKKVERLYGRLYEPNEEITITSGATEAIMAAILATVHQGDEVIVIEPSYDCYVPAIRLAGGQAIFVEMTPPTNVKSAIPKSPNILNSFCSIIVLSNPETSNSWHANGTAKTTIITRVVLALATKSGLTPKRSARIAISFAPPIAEENQAVFKSTCPNLCKRYVP